MVWNTSQIGPFCSTYGELEFGSRAPSWVRGVRLTVPTVCTGEAGAGEKWAVREELSWRLVS